MNISSAQAIRLVLDELTNAGILGESSGLDAVAFKAVMAGDYEPAAMVDEELLGRMEYFSPVAPAHNPPYIAAMRMFVDASADLDNAARCILEGASYDNNLLCLAEKEVFVVAEVFDAMLSAMERAGAFRLDTRQMDELAKICLKPGADGGHPAADKKFVGAEPQVIAQQIGVSVPPTCRLLFGETGPDNPFVQAEQMMPVLPFVRCESFYHRR